MPVRPCQAWPHIKYCGVAHGCEFIVRARSLSFHLCAPVTAQVKGPYAVLMELFSSALLFVLSLRLPILAHAFHLQSIPIELFMKGK